MHPVFSDLGKWKEELTAGQKHVQIFLLTAILRATVNICRWVIRIKAVWATSVFLFWYESFCCPLLKAGKTLKYHKMKNKSERRRLAVTFCPSRNILWIIPVLCWLVRHSILTVFSGQTVIGIYCIIAAVWNEAGVPGGICSPVCIQPCM